MRADHVRITIAILLALLLVWLQYRLWLGDGGIPGVLKLETEVEIVRAETEKLHERNQALEAEVHDLKQGLEAIEERARSEMGMIREGEAYFQVIDSLPPAPQPDVHTDD
jgi:cell division protein FtsB